MVKIHVCVVKPQLFTNQKQQKPTPNAVTQNCFVKETISIVLQVFPLFPYQCGLRSVERGRVHSVECEDSEDSEDSVMLSRECSVKGKKWRLWSECRV